MCYRQIIFFTLFSLFFISSVTAQNEQIDKEKIQNQGTYTKTRQGDIGTSDSKIPSQQAEQSGLPGVEKSDKNRTERLESFLFNDETVRDMMFTWRLNRYTNTPVMGRVDTLINDKRADYPFYHKDIGATYLGISGSAAVTFDYFKRETHDYMYTLTPYIEYRVTPDNLSFYNTRSPFTRFTYSGTLFANRNFEETNIEVLHTQNITPELNAGLMYRRLGANGLLTNEAVDNRAFTIFSSYTGKRYSAHAGYIYNRVHAFQNGGITHDSNILDTTMDARTIEVNLKTAEEKNASNTFFLTHAYGLPLKLFRGSDDTLRAGQGSIIYFGNSLEYTTIYRIYTDNIQQGDTTGRRYYNDVFNINPILSNDSTHSKMFDAKFFVSLQPFSPNFIISKIGGGIGYQYLSNYGFQPDYYIRPISNNTQNNFYIYANALGSYKRYFSWSAFARYYLTGYSQNDVFIKGDAAISFYPLKQGIHLKGSVSFNSHTPDYFIQNHFSNHFYWKENFDKVVETKIQASVSVPDWQAEVSFGHSLLSSPLFFDNSAMPKQSSDVVSILAFSGKKNFQVWLLHFDTRFLIQHTSDADIIPLPLASLNLDMYVEFDLVKNVLRLQAGAEIYYNTKYHVYAFNPAVGAFHTQSERKIGDFPYINAFLNAKWKRATFFIKLINAGEGWPSSDYFSALHYIRPQRAIKFGISWPFYL
jgi:hypothetical protein